MSDDHSFTNRSHPNGEQPPVLYEHLQATAPPALSPSLTDWLDQMSQEGWELLSHTVIVVEVRQGKLLTQAQPQMMAVVQYLFRRPKKALASSALQVEVSEDVPA